MIFYSTLKKTTLKFVKQTLAKAHQKMLGNSLKLKKYRYTYCESFKIVSQMMPSAVLER